MTTVDYTKNEYHETRHAEFIENIELQFAWSECAKDFYFNDIGDGATVFEFGGALGYNLLALSRKHECHMLELSEIGRFNASKYGITTYTDVTEVGDKKFDAVLCRHVLEHVDDPLAVLCLLKNMLKANGKLILILPLEKNDQPPVPNEIDYHLFTWNPRTIINLLRKAGFEKTNYRYQHFNGRRLCMPILRLFGARTYVKAVSLIGYITRSKELVVECA